MKQNIISLFVLLCGAIIGSAQPTIESFATANSAATEASLSSLDSSYEVPDTQVATTNSVSFASKIMLPAGTTSATITDIKFSVDRVINGSAATQLGDFSMNASSFTLEGSASFPNVFARDAAGTIISMSGALQNNPIPNAKTIFITKQGFSLGGAFAKMVKEGDMWKIRRTVSVSYTVSAVTTTATLTSESSVSVWFYPSQQPVFVGSSEGEGSTTYTFSGLTLASYGITWWFETSADLQTWSKLTEGVTIDGNVNIHFPQTPGDPKRFYRVGYIPNPNPSSSS